MKLETKRLIIRPFEFSDDIDLYEMCRDHETAYNAGWSPHENIEISRNIVFGYMYQRETFAICLKDNRKLIGTISLYSNNLRKKINCREMGFCLNKKYRHYGYMQEAISKMLEYGFTILDLDLIMICHHTQNFSCERLVRKFPFKYEGTLRMYRTLYDGTKIDAMMYSMTKEEYKEEILNERNETKIRLQ